MVAVETIGWRKHGSAFAAKILIVLAACLLLPASARPASHHHRYHLRRAHVTPYHAALLEDADSGQVLFEVNEGLEWPPASMAKMMLLLVTERQIQAGRLHLSDLVRISRRVAATGGSRLGLRQGQLYPLGELMKAALIRSANDAAVAIAETVGRGSVERCVQMMNEQARMLGLTGTVYRTVDGLPPRPGHDVDLTDAADLARLARELIFRTNLLKWSELEAAPFDGGVAILRNTNHLIGHFPGCDGLKTGFTFKSGFNLTATAKRGNLRLIAVVLGAPSNRERFHQAALLMNWGFDNFTRLAVLQRGQVLPVHVRTNTGSIIEPVAGSSLTLLLPRTEVPHLRFIYAIPPLLTGPVAPGASLGHVQLTDQGRILGKVIAVCPLETTTLRTDTEASRPDTDQAVRGIVKAVPSAPTEDAQ